MLDIGRAINARYSKLYRRSSMQSYIGPFNSNSPPTLTAYKDHLVEPRSVKLVLHFKHQSGLN